MKMPSKIYVCEGTMGDMGSSVSTEPPPEGYPENKYIRADLAEDLARALEAYIFGENDITDMSDLHAALARYNEATK